MIKSNKLYLTSINNINKSKFKFRFIFSHQNYRNYWIASNDTNNIKSIKICECECECNYNYNYNYNNNKLINVLETNTNINNINIDLIDIKKNMSKINYNISNLNSKNEFNINDSLESLYVYIGIGTFIQTILIIAVI